MHSKILRFLAKVYKFKKKSMTFPINLHLFLQNAFIFFYAHFDQQRGKKLI